MKIPQGLNFISILLFAVCARQNKWQPMIYAGGSIHFVLSPVLGTSVGQRHSEGGSMMSAAADLLMSVVSYLFIYIVSVVNAVLRGRYTSIHQNKVRHLHQNIIHQDFYTTDLGKTD